MIIIDKSMKELMLGVTGETETTAEADNLLETIFYLLCKLEHGNETCFGSRFLEEVTYIASFIHEDQTIIQEYTVIEHMGIILREYLSMDMKKCERDFINNRMTEYSSSEHESSRMTMMEVEHSTNYGTGTLDQTDLLQNQTNFSTMNIERVRPS